MSLGILIPEQSDADLGLLFEAGLTVSDAMRLGMSPIVFHAQEKFFPLMQRLATAFIYDCGWQLGPNEASDEAMKEEWNRGKYRHGIITLTKVP